MTSRTRWHRAKEAIANHDVVMTTALEEAEPVRLLNSGIFSKVGFESAVDLCDSAPKFYFDKQVMDAMMDRPDQVTKSLVALSDAGVAKLPFPYLLAEYDWGGPNIVIFSESKKLPDSPFRATGMQLFTLRDGRECLHLSPQTFYGSNVYKDKDGHAVINWRVHPAGWLQETPVAVNFARKSVEYWKNCVQAGLMAVLLLLNTRGILREPHPAPLHLNKTRAKKGKPAIPEHTVIRLGYVYERDGGYVPAGEHARRKQPLHWRAGYTAPRWITKRHPKWDINLANDNGQHTILVYVYPYLVNYDPLVDDDLPDIPERRVVWT